MQWVRRWLEPRDRVIERQNELNQLCAAITVDLREGRPQEALDRLAEAWPLADQVAHTDARWRPRLIDFESVALQSLERYDEWHARLTEWGEDPDPVQRAKCDYSLAVSHLAAGRLLEARQLALSALSAFRNFDGDYRQNIALALGALAELENLRALGHPDVREAQAAEALADEAIELWREMARSQDGYTVPPWLELSRLLTLRGRPEEALALLRPWAGRLGALAALAEGRAHLALGHFRHAEISLRRGLDLATEESGWRHTRAACLHLLGDALRSRSDYRAAGDVYRQAAAIHRSGDRWNACVAWQRAAAVAIMLEQPGLALSHADQSIDLAPCPELRALGHSHRGAAAQVTNEHAVALHSFTTALAELESVYGPKDPRLAGLLIHLAGAHRQLDSPEAAREALRRAQSLPLGGRHRLALQVEAALLGEPFEAVRAALAEAPAEIEVAEDLEAKLSSFEAMKLRDEAAELSAFASALRNRLAAG